MKATNQHSITINNKKYFYSLKPKKTKTTFVECEAAKINQEFLNEDVPALLNDLPNLILAEKKYQHQQSAIIRFRVKPEDKKLIEQKAYKKGYSNTSSYIRDLALSS
ncbi:MAG: hypothetical protein U9Q85_00550 [Patescibacteria group bacterium]|nr:hypothetical protein [Patescibacteria group bacterium]